MLVEFSWLRPIQCQRVSYHFEIQGIWTLSIIRDCAGLLLGTRRHSLNVLECGSEMALISHEVFVRDAAPGGADPTELNLVLPRERPDLILVLIIITAGAGRNCVSSGHGHCLRWRGVIIVKMTRHLGRGRPGWNGENSAISHTQLRNHNKAGECWDHNV